METRMIPGYLQKPYLLHKADSGAIRFKVNCMRRIEQPVQLFVIFLSKECPHEQVYLLEFNFNDNIIAINPPREWELEDISISMANHEFWLTWYNDRMCMGVANEQPFLKHPLNSKIISIGFIKFEVSSTINWEVKSPPYGICPLIYKSIEGGELHWVKMSDNKIPSDALIGGYEKEQLYIARAWHRGSLCPGKYVPSQQCAFIPWGFEEHRKDDFEILCGYNAIWLKCKDNYIPENAFVGGISEVNGEYLYIGRAMIDKDLVVGKVHMLYRTCYLPYNDNEHERYTYEILVKGDLPNHGITRNNKCYMNPFKASQFCI